MSYRVDQHHDTSFDEDEALHPSPGLDRNPFARDGTYFESDSQEDSEATGSGDNGRALEPIAIIGLATKFPGDAVNSEAFWETLVKKRSALSKVPKERYNADAFVCSVLGHLLIYQRSAAHTLFRMVQAKDISFERTLVHSMLHSSPSRPRKPRIWIHSNDGCWRLLTML